MSNEDAGLDIIFGQNNPRIEVGDNTYKLSPLSLEDFGEFRSWVKQKRISTLMKARKEANLPWHEFKELTQEILGSSPEMDEETEEFSDDVAEQMGTEAGMNYLVYLSAKKNHPDLEPEDIQLSFEHVEAVTEIIAEISGMAELTEDEEGPLAMKAESQDTPT